MARVGEVGGGGQNTLLDNRFLNISDCLRTSSALLTSHPIVKNVVKKVYTLTLIIEGVYFCGATRAMASTI